MRILQRLRAWWNGPTDSERVSMAADAAFAEYLAWRDQQNCTGCGLNFAEGKAQGVHFVCETMCEPCWLKGVDFNPVLVSVVKEPVDATCRVKEGARCKVCKRLLTNHDSIERGAGQRCHRKLLIEAGANPP